MKKERVQDLTQGNPMGLIIKFMIPLVLGNVMQQFYIMVDAIIVGQGVGVKALAAIGAADWPGGFVLWAVKGFADGFAVLTAIFFGEKDYCNLKKSVNMTILLSVVIGIFFSVGGFLIAEPLYRLLKTPEDIFNDAVIYISIYFLGSVGSMLYSASACILRAVGDSKTPFWAVAISSVLNIVLDLFAVYILNWGVGGAAIATVISITVAGIYCLIKVKQIPLLKSENKYWTIDRSLIVRLMKLGLPMAIQMSFIAVGGMILQSVINSHGFEFVAGFTATNKLNLLMEGAAIALGETMAPYMAQNFGAKKKERIKEGMRCALIISAVVSVVLAAILITFGKSVLMIFISADTATEAVVLDIAYKYLFVMCLGMVLMYTLHVYRQSIMGLGNAFIPMLSGIAELLFRILPALVFTGMFGASALYFAEFSAWFGANLLLIPGYYIIVAKLSFKEKINK